MSARPAGRTIDLSIVVPVHDEAPNLAPLLSEVHSALKGVLDFEVVCVDDGSTDSTWSTLRDLRRQYPGLRALRLRRRCGQSTAIVAGVRAARAPWVATLDGDGQYDPRDIAKLWSGLHEPARTPTRVLVCGWRKTRHDAWIKRVSSRIANAVRGRVLGDRTPDTACGLKVFSRDLFLTLPAFDHMHRFLPALAMRAGAEVRSVPVSHRARRHGRSRYGVLDRLWMGIVDLAGVFWLLRRRIEPALELEAEDESGH